MRTLQSPPPTAEALEGLLAPDREQAPPLGSIDAVASAMRAERARRAEARRRRQRARAIGRRARELAVALVVAVVAGAMLYTLATAGLVRIAGQGALAPAATAQP